VRYAVLELDTGGSKRGPERRGQKGPPEEALAPEGQSRREWPSLPSHGLRQGTGRSRGLASS
jgi:hypothetical protein